MSDHLASILSATNLGRRFGSRWIFRGVSLEVHKGMALAVLGPNGAGKSTLLKLLSGVLEPSEGKIKWPADAMRSIGCASLDLALYPALTAREHLEMAGSLRDMPHRAQELLDQVGLTSAADALAGKYSTGMRARLKLALAIQPKPALLLLDEPSAALDRKGGELVDQVIAEQTSRGALIMATNDPKDLKYATHEISLGL